MALGVSCTGPDGDILLEFLQSPLSFLDRLVQSYGGSVGLRLGGEHVVLLTDPKLSREVLIDQADTFRKVIVKAKSPINASLHQLLLLQPSQRRLFATYDARHG